MGRLSGRGRGLEIFYPLEMFHLVLHIDMLQHFPGKVDDNDGGDHRFLINGVFVSTAKGDLDM